MSALKVYWCVMGLLLPLVVLGGWTLPASSQEALYLGVIGRDGTVIPFARYGEGEWSAPWSEPSEDPSPPTADLPDEWYVYEEGADPSRVRVLERVLTDTHCVRNWALTTDWKVQRPRRSDWVREIAGMVSSRPLELIDEDSISGIEGFRERFGLVSNDEQGERSRRSFALGYFSVDDRLAGVFFRGGYEGERYEVYELTADGGELVVGAHGGGC